ncbi:MAG: penicillin-binding protein 1C [Candidatus Cloacimonetes bacterium]|nr:penicillin-binding protein 1C [Candidatus Cloacimonadota bacterium]
MKQISKYIILVLILLCFVFALCNYLFPLNTTTIYRPSSRIIYNASNEVLNMDRSIDGYFRINKGLNGIPKSYLDNLLNFEDKYFYYHYGINPFSIIRAIIHNMGSTNRIGASTITMQLARMMEQRDRSYWTKLIECFRAVQLELTLSKDEILAAYLNIAPYGGNIEGIHSASQLYFTKKIVNLSLAEFSYLMIIPKNPEVYKPSKNMQRAIDRRNLFYLSLLNSQKLSLQQYNYLVNEKILASRKPRPQRLPHYARFKRNSTISYTNIDLGLQAILQNKIKQTIVDNLDKGIKNGACVIYDLHKKDYVVWLGSQDFWDDLSLGQNDGILAKRSPGSLLKPFIYAQAVDEGLITPNQLLLDIPMKFGEYSPQNFDKKFYGLISAKEALTLSLNIPAIDLNMALNDDLYDLISTVIDKGLPQNKNYYNQGIVLGGVGLSMLDLLKLYSILANNGIAIGDKHTTISKSSSLLVSKMLEDNFRVNFSAYWDSMKNKIPYSFKTGTSAQGRDLWTIAFDNRFIVGVWYGDFRGEASKNTSGLSVASETVGLAMSELQERFGHYQHLKDLSIQVRKTCQDSIFRYQTDCKNLVDDDWLAHTKIESQCKLLTLQKVAYLHKQKLLPTTVNTSCWSKLLELHPKITSPLDKSKIVISSSIPLNYQKTKLECITPDTKSKIYWFVNSKLLVSTKSGVPFYHQFSEGKYEIQCIDDRSLSSKVEIVVSN